MNDVLVKEIETLNRLEKQMQLMWGRGDNIPEDLINRIQASRSLIIELQSKESPKQ